MGIFRYGLLLALISSSALFGCTSESSQVSSASIDGNPAGNHAPSIRFVKVMPDPLVLLGPLSLHIEAADADRDPVSFRHQWFVNDKPVSGEVNETFPPSMLKRGDRVSVNVVPMDGKTEGLAVRTEPVLVGNTPPVVSRLTLDTTRLQSKNRLQVEIEGSDADRDDVHYTFRWWRNQILLKEGEESVLETAGFVPKDVIVVEVTPHDTTTTGKPMLSEPLVIGNSSPKFVSTPSTTKNPQRYEYMAEAKDPDGDPITYGLETAPPGMTIGSKTGQIVWPITPELKGIYRVRVMAEDGQGGSAFQEFELTLTEPTPSS